MKTAFFVQIKKIDNNFSGTVYTNDKIDPTASRVITTSDLSDHYEIFTIISEGIDKKTPSNQNYELRDM